MLNISKEDIQARMQFDNPWWLSRALPESFARLPHRAYFKPFLRLVKMREPHRSIVLMGPRRVGKTVMLYQAIGDLISKANEEAPAILYLSLDTPAYSGVPLEKLLQYFLEMRSIAGDKQIHVFFDEVQYAENWEQALKSLTDSFRHVKFVVSGSAASALKRGSVESGAGRFTDFSLPPLTFAEHLNLNGIVDELIEPYNNVYRARNIQALNAEFERYVNFGGYPEISLKGAAEAQTEIERFLKADILDRVLLKDLPPLYGISETAELYQLFSVLAYNTGSEVSIDKLAANTRISKNTISKYLEFLEAAFLIRRLERLDNNARRFRRPGGFKVYLVNPSIRTALFGPMGQGDEGFGHLAETAIVAQLMHDVTYALSHRYARWDAGEVDLVVMDRAGQSPSRAYEFKWSDLVVRKPEELKSLAAFSKGNRLTVPALATTRTVWRENFIVDGQSINLRPTASHCYGVGKDLLDHWLIDNNHRSPFEPLE